MENIRGQMTYWANCILLFCILYKNIMHFKHCLKKHHRTEYDGLAVKCCRKGAVRSSHFFVCLDMYVYRYVLYLQKLLQNCIPSVLVCFYSVPEPSVLLVWTL